MTRWVLSLHASSAGALAAVRFLPGAEIVQVEDKVWLRGGELSEADQIRLQQIPAACRFTINEHDELFPLGSRLPVGKLPAGDWQPLARWLQPQLPAMQAVAAWDNKVRLTLARSSHERPAAALLTSMTDWLHYAEHAPQVRLARLKFAASQDQVLIVGQPLPPIAGLHYWQEQGIFVAAGWEWSPPVDATIARDVLQLPADAAALWHADGQWEVLPWAEFVAASRSAVRATAARVQA